MRSRVIILVVAVALVTVGAFADTFVFTDGNAGLSNAINSNGFFTAPGAVGGLFGASAYSYNTHLQAFGADYSDAGLVVDLAGGLTLGEIQSVTVDSTGSPLAINLWLDTSNNGTIFSFDPITFLLTGLAGDSYGGCGTPSLTASSTCQMFAGSGAGGTFSLADLQSGLVTGIDGNTKTALWIGVTNPGGTSQTADINSITVTTSSPNAVPEPGSLLLLGTGLSGLAGLVRRKMMR